MSTVHVETALNVNAFAVTVVVCCTSLVHHLQNFPFQENINSCILLKTSKVS